MKPILMVAMTVKEHVRATHYVNVARQKRVILSEIPCLGAKSAVFAPSSACHLGRDHLLP